jgi:peptidoglycan/LPS O-acetylase OafA/YrhL
LQHIEKAMTSKETNKLDYIDALRGIAIMAVVLIHTGQFDIAKYPSFLHAIINKGSRGVQLFYVISAFTIFLSFKSRLSKEKHANLNFFIRRFFRIAPMYYIAIGYYLWQDGLGDRYFLGDQDHITISNIASNFLFLHSFNPYWINSIVPGGWSVAIEMIFYCLVPVLFYRIKNLNAAIIFFIITLCFRFFLNVLLRKINPIADNNLLGEYLFIYLPNQLPVFALGIILFFLILKKSDTTVNPFTFGCLAVLLLIELTLEIPILPNHIKFGVAFFLLTFFLSKVPLKLVVNKIVMYIGTVSYSMYLVHIAVIHWLAKLGFMNMIETSNAWVSIINLGLRLILVLTVSTAICTIFYNLIEVPFQKIGKRIIDKIELK